MIDGGGNLNKYENKNLQKGLETILNFKMDKPENKNFKKEPIWPHFLEEIIDRPNSLKIYRKPPLKF